MAPREPTPRDPRMGTLPRPAFQGRRRALTPADLVGEGAIPILPTPGAAGIVQDLTAAPQAAASGEAATAGGGSPGLPSSVASSIATPSSARRFTRSCRSPGGAG